MSILLNVIKSCPICGREINSVIQLSSIQFGSPDLDFRPPEMERSMMHTWITECPNCRYVSRDFDKSIDVERVNKIIASDEYQKCSNIKFLNILANRFCMNHIIADAIGDTRDTRDAMLSLLNAAWSCDDAGDNKGVALRKFLVDYINREFNDVAPEVELIKADAMRRAGLFEELIAEFKGKEYEDATHNRIIKFQISKAEEHDDKCYSINQLENNGPNELYSY